MERAARLLRDVTDEEIARYREAGVVRLERILGPEWLDLLAAGIDEVLYAQWGSGLANYDVSVLADEMADRGIALLSDLRAAGIEKRGKYLTTIGAWTINQKLRRFVLESPLPAIAARLFGASTVNLYDDQVFVKEPGAREYSAFHTDEPYYHLSGDQVCGMWVSPDVVTAESGAMRYVRGSHRWPQRFRPNAFASQVSLGALGLAQDAELEPLPDIEGDPQAYDIVTYPSNPGDVIVHHSRLVHGSGPNYTTDRRRRATSVRYAGDDVRYAFRKSAPPQPHHRHSLKDGDRLAGEQFPVVWRKTGPG
jgi:ectoine hydroxylase-related dioxygenase (phytanoyl-CoA dioxygenase family)